VDCGGVICGGCVTGSACSLDGDCASMNCVNNATCAAPAENDNIRNGDEACVDGGEGQPRLCNVGEMCSTPRDCQSNSCFEGQCQAVSLPTCDDGVQNQGEAPEGDCGDSAGRCSKCSAGDQCSLASQCASNICRFGICVDPSCTDGVRNQGELGVDCMGPCARKCPDATACTTPGQCSNGVCSGDSDAPGTC